MKRGIVWIGHESLATLLRLKDGEYVHAVDTSWMRMAVGVCVAGPDLPDVAEGMESPSLELNEYVDLNLRAKLLALVARWNTSEAGGWSSENGKARWVGHGDSAEAVLDTLAQVLDGDFDPRIEMHGPDLA